MVTMKKLLVFLLSSIFVLYAPPRVSTKDKSKRGKIRSALAASAAGKKTRKKVRFEDKIICSYVSVEGKDRRARLSRHYEKLRLNDRKEELNMVLRSFNAAIAEASRYIDDMDKKERSFAQQEIDKLREQREAPLKEWHTVQAALEVIYTWEEKWRIREYDRNQSEAADCAKGSSD